MLKTPREALLEAENARLKAENQYLRGCADPAGSLNITPIAAIDEVSMSALSPTVTIPMVAGISGHLTRHGTYHVLARLKHARAEELAIAYYAPGDVIKSKADFAINELFPFLHERFVWALASAIRDENT